MYSLMVLQALQRVTDNTRRHTFFQHDSSNSHFADLYCRETLPLLTVEEQDVRRAHTG